MASLGAIGHSTIVMHFVRIGFNHLRRLFWPKLRPQQQQLCRLPTAVVRLMMAILQAFHNSMHRFLYLRQQRQTHRCCLHLRLGVRMHFRSRKERARTMRKVAPEFAKGGKPEFAEGGKDDKGGFLRQRVKGEFKGEKGDKEKQDSKGPTLSVPKASGCTFFFLQLGRCRLVGSVHASKNLDDRFVTLLSIFVHIFNPRSSFGPYGLSCHFL